MFLIVLQHQLPRVQGLCPPIQDGSNGLCYYDLYDDINAVNPCKCCIGQKRYWRGREGQHRDFSSYDCTPCETGKYQPVISSSTTCIDCPAGSYSASTGSFQCTLCEAGKYSTATGAQTAAVCINCATGKISNAGATRCMTLQEKCLASACPFNSWPGEKTQTACHCCSGQRLEISFHQYYEYIEYRCLACETGFYMNQNQQTFTTCTMCVDGKQSSGGTTYYVEPYVLGSNSVNWPYTGATECIDCVAGTYNQRSVNGIHTCDPCLPGSYATTSGQTVCQKCTAGKYLALPGQTSDVCLSCVAGTFSTAGASACTSCLPGSYSATSGLAACQQCTAGKYLALPGQTSDVCMSCVAGTYSTAGASVCTDCTAGKYFSLPSQTNDVCVSCVAGTYSAAGASVCTDCTAGKYFSLAGQTSNVCISCVAGKYSTAGSSVCTDCPAGKYSGSTGLRVCTDCLAERYAYPGALTCDFCVAGKEKAPLTEGVNAIGMCPPVLSGVWTSYLSQYKFSSYSIDKRANGLWVIYSQKFSENSLLPAGVQGGSGIPWVAYVVDLVDHVWQITAPWNCWDKSESLWKSFPQMRFLRETCVDCAEGKYKETPEGSSCVLCPANSNALAKGSTACQCNPGYTGAGGWNCTACAANYYKSQAGNASCTPCAVNSTSPTGSTSAQACRCIAGFTGEDGGQCTVCPPSTYKPDAGSHACTSCRAHTAHPLTGQVNNASCVCDAGYRQITTHSRFVSGDCDSLLNGQYEAMGSETSTSGWPKWQKTTDTIPFQLLCTKFGGSDRFVIIEPVSTFGGYDYMAYSEEAGCQMNNLQMWQCPDVSTRVFRRATLRVESKLTLGGCESCPERTYKILLGDSLCLPCSDHSTSEAASRSASACVCDAGYAPMQAQSLATPIQCSACIAGKFKNATSRAPSNATSGHYIESEKCQDCDAGLYAAIRV